MTPHPTELDDPTLLSQCRLTRGRTSGPGGQHRNKVETKITLVHVPTGLEAQAGERRRAQDNQRVALTRLRLELAVRVRRPRADGPSELWRSRCHRGRMSINPSHRDFPSLLAEALDVLEREGWETVGASAALGCSSSQLIKLVKLHPPAFQVWNRKRTEAGRRPLR